MSLLHNFYEKAQNDRGNYRKLQSSGLSIRKESLDVQIRTMAETSLPFASLGVRGANWIVRHASFAIEQASPGSVAFGGQGKAGW